MESEISSHWNNLMHNSNNFINKFNNNNNIINPLHNNNNTVLKTCLKSFWRMRITIMKMDHMDIKMRFPKVLVEKILNITPRVWGQKPVKHALSWTGFDKARRQEPIGHFVHVVVEQVLTELVDRILSGTLSWAKGVVLELGGKRGDLDLEVNLADNQPGGVPYVKDAPAQTILT
ncbi:hypothetical protein ACLOJK_029260 [Asimina triloba]